MCENDYLFQISYLIGEINLSFVINNNKWPFTTLVQTKY
jgi:hypothetical protein